MDFRRHHRDHERDHRPRPRSVALTGLLTCLNRSPHAPARSSRPPGNCWSRRAPGWCLIVLDGRGVWAYGRWRTPGVKGNPVYPGPHARERAGQAAFVMASTGQSVSYAEYEARTNRLAHLLRARGLGRLDHYAIFMENNDRYLEA